jgi:carboxyl-terminal processing protease
MKKLILDLRDNPGGSLDEAIRISGFFIPKGSLVVDTKGKYKDWDKSYKTSEAPLDTQIPLIVLINESSASASEIVSGVVQDYDRAVVMGVKSFGKGLVQTVRPLTYNTQLKVTTAKYYTPSGRCVQSINYSQKGKTTRPDSLKVAFKTKNGRTVYDGGGVSPDLEVKELESPLVLNALFEKRLLFDFATNYRLQNPTLIGGKDFQISNGLFQEFKAFLKERKFDYLTESEKMLEQFKNKAKKEHYYEAVKDEFEKLTTTYHHDKSQDVDKNRPVIEQALREEIISRYLFQKGRIEASLSTDVQVKKAMEVLGQPDMYQKYLKRTQP